jgi:hypothetical protein
MDIFLGKKKNIILSCLSLGVLLVVLFFLDYHNSRPVIFWLFVVLFIAVVYKTIHLLTNKNLLFISSEDLKNNTNTSLSDNDSSIVFEFTNDELRIKEKDQLSEVQWTSITTILGYKKDLITYDTICLDIVFNNRTLTICEESAGWVDLLEALKKQFPGIPDNWYLDIMKPAFKTNLILLYDRQNRILEEVMNNN